MKIPQEIKIACHLTISFRVFIQRIQKRIEEMCTFIETITAKTWEQHDHKVENVNTYTMEHSPIK